mmetsp:Transcript_56126/g.62848  ORF Transcript_56126/g.62848 Transcript_56126/m.62848 type:complete len:84 (-) Transcript_56126:1622-1873(-)
MKRVLRLFVLVSIVAIILYMGLLGKVVGLQVYRISSHHHHHHYHHHHRINNIIVRKFVSAMSATTDTSNDRPTIDIDIVSDAV